MSHFGWDMRCRLFGEHISLRVRLGLDHQKWKLDAAMNLGWKTGQTI
jgi:hypothetical protein